MPNSVINTDAAGVTFRSYRDGAYIELTPRSSVIAQKQLRVMTDVVVTLTLDSSSLTNLCNLGGHYYPSGSPPAIQRTAL